MAVCNERHCKHCGSSYLTDFATEACIHVPGRENLNVPAVFVFPRLAICLDCGTVSDFQIPTGHLTELKKYVRPQSGYV